MGSTAGACTIHGFKCKAALEAGLDIAPVITHKFKFEEYEEAMALLNSGRCGKVLLIP